MRLTTLVLAAAVSLLAAAAPAQEKAPSHPTEPFDVWGIHWQPSIAAAQKLAAEDGKPVILYFTYDK